MFVNVSPASFNLEETKTSLYYASRVKKITNDAQKNVESAQFMKLRHNYDTLIRTLEICVKNLKDNKVAIPQEALQYYIATDEPKIQDIDEPPKAPEDDEK